MNNFERYTKASFERLAAARQIADDLKHDEALHRLAMKAVFVLEDVNEALTRLSGFEGPKPSGKDTPAILP